MSRFARQCRRYLSPLGFDPVNQADISHLDALLRRRRGDRIGAADALVCGGPLVIAYPDHFTAQASPALDTLGEFLDEQLAGLPILLHLLPCWSSTGDGGFAISDPTQLRSDLGTLDHLTSLLRRHHVCLDVVANHVSTGILSSRGICNPSPAATACLRRQ